MSKNIYRYFLLFIAAFIWGSAFVAQRVGMDSIGPFTFLCVRSIIGHLFLIPVACICAAIRKNNKKHSDNQISITEADIRKNSIVGGLYCGLILFAASSLQQIGICYTTAGKSGFITALYVVLVPLTGIFLKKKNPATIYFAVAMAVTGLFFLCIEKGNDNFLRLGLGEGLTLLCAVFFTLHILVIDYFSPKADGVAMSCVQFFVVSILAGVSMTIFETPDITGIKEATFPILYAGIMSSGIAFTFQIIGQKGTNPTITSIIMCLESVFSVLTGYIILHEELTVRHLAGCIFMFAAILMSQIPAKAKTSK